MSGLARAWGPMVVRGGVAVLFGIAAMVWPKITVLVLVVLWGVFAIVDGLFSLALGTSGRDPRGRAFLIFAGVVGVLAGLVAFIWPGVTAVVLLVLIAIWALVVGGLYLAAAWRFRGELRGDWLFGVTGVLALALGVVLLIRPASGAVAMAWAIGLLAAVWGVSQLVLGLRLRGLTRRAPARLT